MFFSNQVYIREFTEKRRKDSTAQRVLPLTRLGSLRVFQANPSTVPTARPLFSSRVPQKISDPQLVALHPILNKKIKNRKLDMGPHWERFIWMNMLHVLYNMSHVRLRWESLFLQPPPPPPSFSPPSPSPGGSPSTASPDGRMAHAVSGAAARKLRTWRMHGSSSVAGHDPGLQKRRPQPYMTPQKLRSSWEKPKQ